MNEQSWESVIEEVEEHGTDCRAWYEIAEFLMMIDEGKYEVEWVREDQQNIDDPVKALDHYVEKFNENNLNKELCNG